jgi:hypothetical protein
VCLSPDAFVALSVFRRLTAAGVDEAKAEAVAAKVARKYRSKRNHAYRRYLAGIEDPHELLAYDPLVD